MNNKYLTVTAITRYLKSKFDSDIHLNNVLLKGEISNFKAHTTGHMYFSIKDEHSKINAIMFKANASKLDFKPADGSKVLLVGRISVYEAVGNYQIYVDKMIEDGVGNLYIAYEKLKKKLEEAGYFRPEHKKPIPKYPKKVGIVTASTGAAVRDIITTIKRRFPVCETLLFPTMVQGENAKESIAQNIKRAENYNIDVLIVGRGGGSIEDLWAFNEEIVADAIYQCKIPVISAVGHEVDFTISDFVADLRAPTPTAAAELAVPNLLDLNKMLSQYSIRLKEAIIKKIKLKKIYFDSIKSSYVLKTPMVMYENKKQTISLINEKINTLITNKITENKTKLDNIKNTFILNNPKNLYIKQLDYINVSKKRINELFINIITNKHNNLNHQIEKLELLNPLNTIKRGYSITYINDSILTNKKQLNKNDEIKIKIIDAEVKAVVKEIK